jgi:hypothetical protein
VPCSVETQCYYFSQASEAEFYKPGRILQAQTSALAVGRGLEPSKIRFPNSRMPIGWLPENQSQGKENRRSKNELIFLSGSQVYFSAKPYNAIKTPINKIRHS